MKKDYVQFNDEIEYDDLHFIDNFWSERWQNQKNLPDPNSVASREEFRLTQPYLESAGRGARVLDAGCGMGEWTVYLNQLGYKTLGLDISDITIQRLQTIFSQYEFKTGDIRKTGFPDNSFDLLFSWGAFEHFENGPAECLEESFRILKPGGWLLISVPFDNWRHVIKRMHRLEYWDPHYHPDKGYAAPMRFYQWRFTKSEIEMEVALAGFKVLWIKPISKGAGISRWLKWDMKIAPSSKLHDLLSVPARLLAPSGYLAHMLMVAACKPRINSAK